MKGRIRHFYKIALRAVIYACLRPLIECFRLLPPHTASGMGGFLGRFLYIALTPGLGRVRGNLARAFPGIARHEREEILARHFRHLGFILGEYLSLTFRDPLRMKRMVRVEGFEPVERACAIGRGVVILTAHLGSWELAAAAVAMRTRRTAAVARELYDKNLDLLSKRLRAHFGVETIDTRNLRTMLRVLRGGGVLGVLADQSSLRVANVTSPFFGAPVQTPEGPIRLARQTESLLVTGFIIRERNGYRLTFESLSDDPRRESARDLLAAYNRRLERYVRSFPEQWLWLHDRWRYERQAA